jgi:hypothetical protein
MHRRSVSLRCLYWLAAINCANDSAIVIIVIIIIGYLIFIYNYPREIYHISRVYDVAAILWLQFMVGLHVMLFPLTNVLYFYISSFRSVQCPRWLFSRVP